LSIIVPVYNEEKTLLKSLKSVRNLNTNLCKHEIIVINDGSKDNSGKILNENKNLLFHLLKEQI
jgi:glycosyltransferase involved in cell wall biosynthesis